MKKIISSFVLLLAVILILLNKGVFTSDKELSTSDFVKGMGVGWNLGNSLDVGAKDKTDWGNPLPTKALIDSICAKGFKTLRVPVTWQFNLSSAPEYRIEKDYLDMVEEVVNYALDNDMYVIVNIHHDEQLIIPTYTKYDESAKVVSAIWSQVSERFKDYDDKLIFETLNEMRVKGSPEEWQGGTAEGRDCLNKFHAEALKIIRNSGGNNASRKVMLSTYAASCNPDAQRELVIPDDENIIVSLHNYYPYDFCMKKSHVDAKWGSDDDKASLDAEFDRINEIFISKGIPVIMGEWGCFHKNDMNSRIAHAKYYVKACLDLGICPVVWDNGVFSEYGLINRHKVEWVYPEVADAIVEMTK